MLPTTLLRIALPTPLRRLFDYLPPEGVDPSTLLPGVRVKVPFQSRILIGILMEVVQESAAPKYKLKSALSILDTEALLTPDVTQLCQWAANYYHHPLGEIFANALPVLLRKGKPAALKKKALPISAQIEAPKLLNSDQQTALTQIIQAKNTFRTFLLDGVTGSGKTEVYLQAIADVLQDNKQVLVLVPEISLTPQTIARFSARFAVPIVTLHSSLSEQKRLQAWLHARAGSASIVIGTRSAIFTPFAALGLIIVDEEHDNSFKQQDRFRYHARDLAVMRGHVCHVPVVLGSATPSLESLLNVKRERYALLTLQQRAGGALLPQYHLVDLRREKPEEGLTATLLQTMRTHLASGNQVLLFLNRRGYAPVYYCPQCTWMAGCKQCATKLVYHRSPPSLRCHQCDARISIPLHCAECGSSAVQPIGLGTQRLEASLAKHFPNVPLIRIDRDSTRTKNSMQDLLEQIHQHPSAILLGTQMLAKGHHFPNVTLVGIIEADSGWFSIDYHAAEQLGQLLIQVAGRAGRAEKQGTVLIQTQHPNHPLLQTLLYEGYAPFANTLLTERRQAHLPPYSFFAILKAEARQEAKAQAFLQSLKDGLTHLLPHIELLGPVPALLAKRKGFHCQHLFIKSPKRAILQQFLTQALPEIEKTASLFSVKWILDIDPTDT